MSENTNTMQPVGARFVRQSGAGLVLLYAQPLDCSASVVSLASTPFAIGREAPRGGLTLDVPSVSRLHAELAFAAGAWRIADLKSRNGTFVGGRRVVESAPLYDGDEIRIGDVLFKFVEGGIEDHAPYRVDGGLAPGAAHRSNAVPELVGGLRVDSVRAEVEAAARSDLPVLALGESGTGKELVARAVHRLSGRGGPLCAINCAAVPAGLFESELFGVRKGAFTGADRDKIGLVKAAEGGTLFLDEIGDMPFDMQAKLLRVLETREVRAVGSTHAEVVDTRVVCATHRDLLARLHGFEITLPPLRERKEDLYQLVCHFLARAGRPAMRLSFAFMLALCDHDWPFNVRECETLVRRAVAVVQGAELDVAHLPEALRERAKTYGSRGDASGTTTARARAPSADELRAWLTRHQGNVSAVARELGKDPKQIHRWMRRYGIAAGDFRA